MAFFKKSKYSDLEIQEILGTLFEEKKKVKDLELKLKNSYSSTEPPQGDILPNESVSKIPSERALTMQIAETEDLKSKLQLSEEEVLALKNQLAALKKDFEKPNPSKEGELHLKLTHLERTIQFMRQKIDSQNLENQELLKKYALADEELKKVSFELFQTKEVQRKLSQSLQKEKQHGEEIAAEEEALKTQLEQLKNSLSDLQDQKVALQSEKTFALQDAQEQRNLYTNSQREIEVLKQTMTKTLQEFKEERQKNQQALENQISEMQELKIKDEQALAHLESTLQATINHNTSLQETARELEKKILDNAQQFAEQSKAHGELTQFIEDLKQKLISAEKIKQNSLESLQKKEEHIESLNGQVSHLSHSLADVEESLEQAIHERQESESRLRVAQQHLAKKVRESTVLSEKNEELQLKSLGLEQQLDGMKKKLLETQTHLDAANKHQKHLSEQYQENLKAMESQAAKWEQKYFHIHERWQDAENKSRELKKLEEKFLKLKGALSQLGTLLSPLSFPEIETIAHESLHPQKMATPAIHPKEIFEDTLNLKSNLMPEGSLATDGVPVVQQMVQDSFFDTPSKNTPFKDTLFS